MSLSEMLPESRRGDLPLPAVVHAPVFIDENRLVAFAGTAGAVLLSTEHAPNAGDRGNFIPQHPLPAHVQLAAPHRQRLVGAGELVTDGLDLGALLRNQGIPQAPVRPGAGPPE